MGCASSRPLVETCACGGPSWNVPALDPCPGSGERLRRMGGLQRTAGEGEEMGTPGIEEEDRTGDGAEKIGLPENPTFLPTASGSALCKELRYTTSSYVYRSFGTHPPPLRFPAEQLHLRLPQPCAVSPAAMKTRLRRPPGQRAYSRLVLLSKRRRRRQSCQAPLRHRRPASRCAGGGDGGGSCSSRRERRTRAASRGQQMTFCCRCFVGV
jgi:hypothetical protein